MVDEAVDHGGSNDVVAAENLAPPAEGLIGRDDQAGRSYREDTSWKKRLAASGSNGM